jgi:2-polyprenyl-3-methyl-5-hydroxy-6-metoxy-1,4-benzoquinol methylase
MNHFRKPRKFNRFENRRDKPAGPRPNDQRQGWQNVAGWYSNYLEGADTYQETVVFPGVLKLLGLKPGVSCLDIACGEGSFAAKLAASRVRVTGFDAAPALVERAKRHVPQGEFLVGDAQHFPAALRGRDFDAATCILAIQNIPDAAAVLKEAAAILKPGAPLVLVTNHPCFRIPRQSSWGFDDANKTQFRRVDRYLTPLDVPIIMNPGRGQGRPVTTTTYHRPISAYIATLAAAGFVVDALEEWISNRVSDSGPRAKAENRAREEFPLFLAIRARHR